MNIINGRLIADKIKDQIAKEVFDLCANSTNPELNVRRPSLAILLIGNRPDCELYVSLKEKAAKGVGIDTSLYKFNETADEAQILETIKFLNTDETTDGILVQLPLPNHIDTDKIIETINPHKDVDGFHPANLEKIENNRHSQECNESGIQTDNKASEIKIPARASLPNGNLFGRNDEIISPVFQSVLVCLDDIKFTLKDKSVAIVAKPSIFTQSLDKLLENFGAKVLLFKPEEVGAKTASADLLISAVGQADLINADDIKTDAVLIDIGISQDETGKTCGDVNAESVSAKASALTPVPGGIGPLTIAFALKNTLEFYKTLIPKS